MSNSNKNLIQDSRNVLRRNSNSWNVSSIAAVANNYTEIGRIPALGTLTFNSMEVSTDGEYLTTLDSNGIYKGFRLTPNFSVSNTFPYNATYPTLNNVAMVPKSEYFKFSNDGNTVFMMCEDSGVISSTSLSTSFDIHSASNSSIYTAGNSWMRVNSSDPLFVNVSATMSSDGTTLLASDRLSNVIQYTLSEPGNLETAYQTYVWSPILGTSNEIIEDLSLSSDSSNVYLLCTESSPFGRLIIRQFSMSSPNYINTAVEVANSDFITRSNSTFSSRKSNALYIDPTGSNVYIAAAQVTNSRIISSPIANTYDISTANSFSMSLDFTVSPYGQDIGGLALSSDGLYLITNGDGYLWSYPLSNAWDVATANIAVYSAESLRYRTSERSRSLSFFNGGDSALVAFAPLLSNRTQPIVHKLDFAESWNINSHYKTVSDNGVLFTQSSMASAPTSFTIDSTGTNVYASLNTVIHQFKLPSPWDFRGASYSGSANPNRNVKTLYISNAESSLNIYSLNGSTSIDQYSLNSNGAISSLSFVKSNTILNADSYTLFTISANNEYLYTKITSAGGIIRYDLNNSANISSATFSSTDVGRKSLFDSVTELDPWDLRGLYVTPDGTRAFVKGSLYLYEYRLDTPWLVDTAVYVQKVSNPLGIGSSNTLYISPDGRTAHTANSNTIVYMSMATPWDITSFPAQSASVKQLSAGVLGSLNPIRGFRMNPQGDSMIVYGNRYLISYSINNFDVSSASYSGESYYNASLGTSLIYDFDISTSGRNIFIPYPTTSGLTIRKYKNTNPTAWRANDFYMFLDSSKEIASVPLYANGFCIDPTGSKAILLDSNTATMYSYYIGS